MPQAKGMPPQARNMSSAAESPNMLSLEEASAVQLLSDSNCMAQSICHYAMRARQAMRVAQLSVPHKLQVFSIAQSLLDHHGPGDICPLGTHLSSSPLCPINGPLGKWSAWRLSTLLCSARQVRKVAVPPTGAERKGRRKADRIADLVGLGADAGLPAARPGRGVADLQVLLLDELRKDAGALAGRPPALLAAVRVGRLH